MAPKPAQEAVLELRRSGQTEAAIRARLLAEGKSASRVSQLLKATRSSAAPEARYFYTTTVPSGSAIRTIHHIKPLSKKARYTQAASAESAASAVLRKPAAPIRRTAKPAAATQAINYEIYQILFSYPTVPHSCNAGAARSNCAPHGSLYSSIATSCQRFGAS